MFIYEFMAGLGFGDNTGARCLYRFERFKAVTKRQTDRFEEAVFDPHHHRKIHKPTTYMDTMIHLLKGSIGAGILAMPDAFSRLGVPYAVLGLVLLGIFATYCIHLLILAQYAICLKHHRGYVGYPKSMLLALRDGPPCLRCMARCFYYFVDVVLVVWQLGICCIYLVFVASNVKQILDYHDVVFSLRMHMCFVLLPAILTNLVKDLKLMTPMSGISNIAMMFGLVLVFFYLVEDDLEIHDSMMRLKSLQDVPVFIGTCLFAMEAVGVVLALEYNMDNPKEFGGPFGLFNIGMAIIIAMYLLVGVFGYLKYGDAIMASVTLNLPHEEKKAQAAKIIFAVAIFLTFPLQNFVAYTIMWRRIAKRMRPGGRRTFVDYLLRVLLVVIPWMVAVAVPTLGPFIALFGALCLSLLAIVFPAIIDMCVLYPDGYGCMKYKLLRDLFIIVVGVFCLVSGVYTSILEIIHELF